jgi:hypothetical protein
VALTLSKGEEVRRELVDHIPSESPGPPAGREAPRRHADA